MTAIAVSATPLSYRNSVSARLIERTTTASVVLLAGIAALVSYWHMHALAMAHGEGGLASALIPPSVDGMIVASSMSLLLDSRLGRRGGVLPWLLLMAGGGGEPGGEYRGGRAVAAGAGDRGVAEFRADRVL